MKIKRFLEIVHQMTRFAQRILGRLRGPMRVASDLPEDADTMLLQVVALEKLYILFLSCIVVLLLLLIADKCRERTLKRFINFFTLHS